MQLFVSGGCKLRGRRCDEVFLIKQVEIQDFVSSESGSALGLSVACVPKVEYAIEASITANVVYLTGSPLSGVSARVGETTGAGQWVGGPGGV
jgi:hypothetical protein